MRLKETQIYAQKRSFSALRTAESFLSSRSHVRCRRVPCGAQDRNIRKREEKKGGWRLAYLPHNGSKGRFEEKTRRMLCVPSFLFARRAI